MHTNLFWCQTLVFANKLEIQMVSDIDIIWCQTLKKTEQKATNL